MFFEALEKIKTFLKQIFFVYFSFHFCLLWVIFVCEVCCLFPFAFVYLKRKRDKRTQNWVGRKVWKVSERNWGRIKTIKIY